MIEKCSDLRLHNFLNMNENTKCQWCRKTIKELRKSVKRRMLK